MSATTLTNTMNNHQSSLRTSASNISEAQSIGGFKVESVSMSRSSSALGGGAAVLERNNFHLKGEISRTGIASDLAIGGRDTTGLFVVKRPNGDIAYTANGSIRQGKDGGFFLADGSAVLGWQFDNAGRLPTNTSTSSSLTPLSLKGVTSKAIPTTKLGLVMNLKASQNALKGAGGNINLSQNSVVDASSIDTIIIPGDTQVGELHLGDQFLLQSSPETTSPTIFEYGGIAVSKDISTSNIYGQSTPASQFAIAAQNAQAGLGQLAQGQALTIKIDGGATYTFTANQALGTAGQNYFNSVNSLASAIQQGTNGQIRARVGVDNRLYIAAADPNKGLAFGDLFLNEEVAAAGTTSLVKNLGLDNVKSATDGVYRFASTKDLQQAMGSVDKGFKATIAGVGLDFSAASALSTLNIGGTALNKRSIQRISAAPTLPNNPLANPGQDWNSRRTVAVGANNHGLKAGDFVRLSGAPLLNIGAGVIPDSLTNGVYQVLDVSADAFYIATGADLVAAGVAIPGGFAGRDLFNGVPPAAGAMNWQKVDGNLQKHAVTAGQTAVVNGGADGTVTWGVTAANMAQYNYAVGDVVYITGSANIRAGYYRLSAITGTSITITIPAADKVANGLAAAHGADGTDNALTIVKVAGRGAAASSLDTLPIETIADAAATRKDVRLYISDDQADKFKVGDIIALRNIGDGNLTTAASVTIDHITLNNNQYYTIKTPPAGVDGAKYITFEGDLDGGGVPAGAFKLGFTHNFSAAALNAAGVGQPSLGANFYVDYIGREFNALGLTIGETHAPVTKTSLDTALVATYAATDGTKNFAGGMITKNIAPPQALNIIDSLGTQHQVMVTFGKLKNNTWAVEVYLPKNTDGSYDGAVANPIAAGMLAYGTLEFSDGDGQLTNITGSINNPISIAWKNGAAASPITIDWGVLVGSTGALGITQIDGDTSVTSISNNGKVPGNVNGFLFDEDGTLSATFDNGETISVGKIALAAFTNFNGLEQKDGFLYESNDSGAVLLKQAGVGGTGNIIVGGVTSSAVDDTGEYMDVINTTQASAMTVNVAAKINSARDQLVSGLAR